MAFETIVFSQCILRYLVWQIFCLFLILEDVYLARFLIGSNVGNADLLVRSKCFFADSSPLFFVQHLQDLTQNTKGNRTDAVDHLRGHDKLELGFSKRFPSLSTSIVWMLPEI